MKITLKFKILISFALSMALFMGCLCGCEKDGGSNKTSEDKNGYVTETMVTSETDETTPEITENSTAVPTAEPAPEDTPVPVVTGTATSSVTAEPTATPKVTTKPTATPIPKMTATPTLKPTATPTPKPTATPRPKPTATPRPKSTATPTPKPTATPTPKPTAAPIPTVNPDVQVGDYVFFGSYEQDNNTSNGKEEIEWLVLDVEDGKALVISKYALDCQPYNTLYTNVTWETCTLRNWLNGTFYNSAFSSGEKSNIVTSYLSAEDNYGTDAGNSTNDKIFLLSISEAKKYFSLNSARQCKPTAYAKAQGTSTSGFYGNCLWWLRSPGYYQYDASYVLSDGFVDDRGFGDSVYYGNYGVRPALWINLE